MYEELKGEYGRRKDCEDWEKEGVNEKDNVKENNRSEELKIEGRQGEERRERGKMVNGQRRKREGIKKCVDGS